jgi:hypothetical protein
MILPTHATMQEQPQVHPILGLQRITRAKREHWWHLHGRKIYVYKVDGSEIPLRSYEPLPSLSDLRSYKEQHPFKYHGKIFREKCEWWSPIISVGMSIFWPLAVSLKKGV